MTQYEETDNHAFRDPDFGATTYDESWTHNLDKLDKRLVLKGTLADRPAAGTEDRWYLAHDEPAIYYDDGNSWTKVADEAATTDSHTDVSEDGTAVVSSVDDINFSTNFAVTDDGDNTVTVAFDGSTTDTHTDVSDGGSLVVGDVDDINFSTNLTVADDGDGSVTITATSGGSSVSDDGTAVLGGSTPTDINFGTDLTVTDDGDGSVTVDSGTGSSSTATEFHATDLGSETDPSFTFDTDLDTGLYSPGADELAATAGGSDSWAIDTDGNVGFPDTSPLHKPSETFENVVDGRPLWTNKALDIYVDPSGSDSNDGSSGSPYATIQRAFDDIPYFVMHDITINVADGTYSNEPGSVRTPKTVSNYIRDHGEINVIGNATNPENVVIDSANWFSIGASGGAASQVFTMNGFTINAKVQGYHADVHLIDCVLNSDTTPGNQSAVGGYASNLVVRRCTFGGNADFAVGMTEGGQTVLQNCSGSVATAIVSSSNQGATVTHINDSSISAPAYTDDVTHPGIILDDGVLKQPAGADFTEDVSISGNGALTDGSNNLLRNNVASGQVQLSSGSADIDTGSSASGATFIVALGIVDENVDAAVDYDVEWDDNTNTHHIDIHEDGTSVGNPTVNYDIIRVR